MVEWPSAPISCLHQDRGKRCHRWMMHWWRRAFASTRRASRVKALANSILFAARLVKALRRLPGLCKSRPKRWQAIKIAPWGTSGTTAAAPSRPAPTPQPQARATFALGTNAPHVGEGSPRRWTWRPSAPSCEFIRRWGGDFYIALAGRKLIKAASAARGPHSRR